MNGSSFKLRGLRLISPTAPSADLYLDRGLNVVSGASDTGKTFALECIDFMLGGSRPLREIDEVQNFSDILLGIENANHVPVTLKRPISGGKFLLINATLETADTTPAATQLAEKHNAKSTRNISGYLLSQCGLWGKRVLVKIAGTTQSVSFRNIARFIIINEDEMFKRGPPFLSGQYTDRTLETSVFRLLLTGIDASTRSVPRSGATEKTRNIAQVQLLDELIQQLEQQLPHLESPDKVTGQIKELEGAIEEKAKMERFAREQIAELEASRQTQWHEKETLESKASNIDGLLHRFLILREQYDSDRERLNAIAEADFFFAQLPHQRCPLCGAEQSGHTHPADDRSPPLLRTAALQEIGKIDVRLRELNETMSFLELERTQLRNKLLLAETSIEQATTTIEQALKPQLLTATETISQLLSHKSELERSLYQREHLASLHAARLEREPRTKSSPPTITSQQIDSTSEVRLLCNVMEELLTAWRFPFPGTRSVRFDPDAQDFVIGGKPRANFGKGLRAISYAAFSISLMLHAHSRRLPHPGFVILDSPLVTYRKKDVPKGEAITDDVKDAFFDDLAKRLQDLQVIVFENEEPSLLTQKNIRYHRFTGNPQFGRTGLLPTTATR